MATSMADNEQTADTEPQASVSEEDQQQQQQQQAEDEAATPAVPTPTEDAPQADTVADTQQESEEDTTQQTPAQVDEGDAQVPQDSGEEPPEESAQVEDTAEQQQGEETGETTAEGETTGEGETAAPEGEDATAAAAEAAEGTEEGATAEATQEDAETQEAQEGAEGEATQEGDTEVQETEGEAAAKPEGEDGETEETPAAGDGEQEKAEDGEGEGDGEGAEEGVEGDETAGGLEVVQEGDEQDQVLQSESFADGERPESPVAVGEKLSREGSPTGSEQQQIQPTQSPPLPETPQPDSEQDEEEEEEEDFYEEEPEFDRDMLLEKYHQVIAERQQLQDQNLQLQHKLADYFRRKKSDDVRQEVDKNVTDQEQRYLKYMANLDELRRKDAEERELYKMQIEELQERCQERQERVDEERQRFMEFKKQVALNSINSRSGKPIAPRDIEQYLQTESRKESEVVSVRLENIKLKNKLKKKEVALKSKEELAEGLHLIDFEQLKIENQTYNEKIEERNEELLKLRKKITSTVQVLTHLKEKLQFVQAENQVQKARLREVEDLAAKKRDILSRTKQARDALRIDNQKLRQNCGLLGNEPLLRDFEERKDEGDSLKMKLEELKMTHAELTLNLNGVRRKIEQSRVVH